MTPVLHIENLSLRRGETEILRNLSWTVRGGERWVILGANGSGKSSLLAAVTGEFPASSGKIAILGQEYGRADWRAMRRRIGVVGSALVSQVEPSERALDLIVGGQRGQLNLWEPPTPDEARAARAFADAAMIRFPLERPWGYLSQGERQRALLARAYAQRPELLFLDEPCSGLDPLARAQLVAEIGVRPPAETPTIVLVTHHLEEISANTTHGLLLRRGKALACGPLDQVLTSENLADLYGCPAQLHGTPGAWRLELARPDDA